MLIFAAGFAATLATTASAAGSAKPQTCQGVAHSPEGVVVVDLTFTDGDLTHSTLLLTRPMFAVPGHGAAVGGDVRVKIDMKYTDDNSVYFEGLGIELAFENNAVKSPIDLSVTAGDASVNRRAMAPGPDGHYSARLGKGPIKTNAFANALDQAPTVLVTVTAAGTQDILVNASVPVGPTDARQALTLAAMNAGVEKSKTGC